MKQYGFIFYRLPMNTNKFLNDTNSKMTFHSVLQVIFCKISAYKQVYTYVRCMQFPARMIVLSFLQRKCKLLLGCCKICDLNFLSHFFPSCTLLQFLLHASHHPGAAGHPIPVVSQLFEDVQSCARSLALLVLCDFQLECLE